MGWLYNKSDWNPIMQPVGSCIYNSDEICNDFTVHVDTLNLGCIISHSYTDTWKKQHIFTKSCESLETLSCSGLGCCSSWKGPNKWILLCSSIKGYFFGLSQELSSFNHLFMLTSRKIPRKNLTESGWSHCRHGPACYVSRQNQTHMTSGHMCRGRPTSETVSSTFKLKF